MGCAPSRPSNSNPTYYDQYFTPSSQRSQHRQRTAATADRYKPDAEYREHVQQHERNIATERYEDAYEQLTARSKLSKAHGLEAYYEDRGWN